MSWNDRYYDAVEFFCWEPQHLGKQRNVESTLKHPRVAMNRLKKLEVTLNHHFDFFFDLAPNALIRRIFSSIFKSSIEGNFRFFGRDVESNFDLEVNTTQPDLFFLNEQTIVSIELKINSKSSVDQALKYAFLGLAADLKDGVTRNHYLAFIAPGEFRDLWNDRYETVPELKTAMLEAADTFKMRSKVMNPDVDRSKFIQLVKDMSISFISYRDFAALLRKEIATVADHSDAAETYRNLLQGMVDEICSEPRKIAL